MSKLEIVVALFILALLLSLAFVVLSRARGQSRAIRDGSQLRGLYQSWLIAARSYNGQLPRPGFVRRLPIMQNGVATIVPGSGSIDPTQDTTANLHSMIIMQNYYSPEFCVGPTEPNPVVSIFDSYNWDLYDPGNGVHWDSNFKADLKKGSHVSYAHMPLFGERAFGPGGGWGESLDDRHLLVGTRGPKDGKHDPNSYTYRILKPYDQWCGHFVFSGGNVETQVTQGVGSATISLWTGATADNPFAMEEGPNGLDAFIGFTKAMKPEGPVLDWD